jgi:hypothetical protein
MPILYKVVKGFLSDILSFEADVNSYLLSGFTLVGEPKIEETEIHQHMIFRMRSIPSELQKPVATKQFGLSAIPHSVP